MRGRRDLCPAASAAGSRWPRCSSHGPRRADPRRADQPPRRRGSRLAGGAPEVALAGERGRPAGRHARPLVPRRGLHGDLGGARPARSSRSRAATPPTSCSACERDRMAAVSEAKRQNLMRKELAWLRRGAPARTSKPKFRIDAANELIADEPPPRDTVALQPDRDGPARQGRRRPARRVGRLPGDRRCSRDIEWRIAPGERTGILGVNGAGKSTLLGLIAGTVTPTSRPGQARQDRARSRS